MKVGIPDFDYRRNDYAYIRNIIRVEDATYVPVEDMLLFLWYHKYRRNSDIPEDLKNALCSKLNVTDEVRGCFRYMFYDADYNHISGKIHLLHFFDGLSLGSTPWVSTVESVLPYNFKDDTNDLFRLSLDRTAGPACKRLLFLSKNAMLRQNEYLSKYAEQRDIIKKKSEVLYPPQPLIVNSIDQKKVSWEGQLRFIFVGGHFFRKGGRPMLQAFEYLKKKGYPIKLSIVSSFKLPDLGDGYPIDEQTVNDAKKFISDNSDWIHLCSGISNDELNSMYLDHHVGVFPTFYDTFGYVSIEQQSAGMPVITTNVRALPEIVDDSNGWVIKLPVNSLGAPNWEGNREKMHEMIKETIIKAVEEMFSDRELLRTKASKSLEKVQRDNDPLKHQQRLKRIYLDAIRR